MSRAWNFCLIISVFYRWLIHLNLFSLITWLAKERSFLFLSFWPDVRILRFPISVIYAFFFLLEEKKEPELGPEVKVLKGNRMTSKTRKTGPCNYCVVKCNVLLDCPLFSCLLTELKAHWVGEGCTLLVTGAEGLLTTHMYLSSVNGICLTHVLFETSPHPYTTNHCSYSQVIFEKVVIPPQWYRMWPVINFRGFYFTVMLKGNLVKYIIALLWFYWALVY